MVAAIPILARGDVISSSGAVRLVIVTTDTTLKFSFWFSVFF